MSAGTATAPTRISIYLGVSRDSGRSWRKLRLQTRTTAVFPTLAVVGLDRVSVAWIDARAAGSPNARGDFEDANWRLQYAEGTGLSARRVRAAYSTVEPLVHSGTVYVGTQGGNRSMGDFLSMAAGPRAPRGDHLHEDSRWRDPAPARRPPAQVTG